MTLIVGILILSLAVSTAYGAPINCGNQGRNDGGPVFDCVGFAAPTKILDPTGYAKTIKPPRTTINIHLAKPEVGYTAQSDEKSGEDTHTYQVTFNYEKLNDKSVHFSDDGQHGSERYSSLRGNIDEPRRF